MGTFPGRAQNGVDEMALGRKGPGACRTRTPTSVEIDWAAWRGRTPDVSAADRTLEHRGLF